jgi:hypothetical protein
MSKYEWERGEIVLPASEWASFRKALIKAHNDAREKDLVDALKALEAIKAASKGKRGENRQVAEKVALATYCNIRSTPEGRLLDAANENAFERHSRLFNLLYIAPEGSNAWAEKTELRTPKKKDLNLLPLTGDADFNCGDGHISLRNATRSVVWSVSENNRACEHAREQPLAKLLFSLLGKIEWTRGSGGKIVGNDEYNRDSDYEGGGSNYVTADYHPLTKAEKEAKARSYYGGYGYSRRW